ncbi:MAG: 4Fe-4S binding protein [Candidatus Bathyarchaeia archaeon]
MAEKAWKAIAIGGVLTETGTSVKYKTGEWRTGLKPSLDKSKCTNCLICWIYCPEPTIIRGEKSVEIDLTYCKGCGICAAECPVKAISMVEE